ncbi:hypothetical protein Tco_0394282 [Tanacetum coccineum]
MMTGSKFDIEKFDGKNDFARWQVLREITKETAAAGLWKKLETLYITKSLANHLYLKKKLYTFHMHPGKSQCEYIDEFHKLYDGGNILLGDGRECRVLGIGKVQVQMRDQSSFVLDNDMYVLELRRNLISLGTHEKEGFTMKMQSGKMKVIKGSLMALSGTIRANCIYTLDGHAVTMKTLKGRKQLGEYQTGWKIKTGNVFDRGLQKAIQAAKEAIWLKGLAIESGFKLKIVDGIATCALSKAIPGPRTSILCVFIVDPILSKILFQQNTLHQLHRIQRISDFIAMISEVNLVGSNTKEWWIDTSATRHVCLNKSLFSSFKEVINGEKLFMENSVSTDIKGEGDVVDLNIIDL